MKTKLVVYDCDGVLFDSENAVLAYYDYIMETFSLPLIDWSVPEHKHIAMISTNEVILSHFVKDANLLADMLDHAKKLNFRKFLHLMQPEEELLETLPKLRNAGYELAIFTNRGSSLPYLLEHFNIHTYFSYTVTCFDVSKPKPDSEGLFKIMNHYQLNRDDLIFVGDSINDYRAAEGAQVPFVAFKNPLGESPVINRHGEIFRYLL